MPTVTGGRMVQSAARALVLISSVTRSRPPLALLTENVDRHAVAAALTPAERKLVTSVQIRLDLGDADMVRLLVRHPEVLGYSFDANILPTMDTLAESLHLTDKDLGKMLLAAPSVLGLSVEDTLLPRLASLRSILSLSTRVLRALALRLRRVLLLSIESNVLPTLAALRSLLR